MESAVLQKKDSKNVIRAIILSVTILVFYSLFLITSADGSNRYSHYVTGYLPEINENFSYEQEIYCNCNNFSSLGVMFATYSRSNEGNVLLELTDDNGEVVGSWEFDASELENNTEYTLMLDEPLSDSKGKTYTFRISSDCEEGKGVTLGTFHNGFIYYLSYRDTTPLVTLLRICPFFLIPFAFYKLRGNTWGTAYALYVVFIIAMHLYMPINTGDDARFSLLRNGHTALSWVKMRWNSWSSRYLQELVMFFLVDRPWFWMAADTVMICTLPLFINRSLAVKGLSRLYVLTAIPLYPILDMESAGWMVTTITYTWMVFSAFVTASILRKIMEKEHLKWYEYPVFFVCLLFASNHELMALYLLAVILYCIVLSVIKRYSCLPFLIASAVVSIVNLAVVLLMCPGNKSRAEREMFNFPNYEDLNILDKIFLGINRCLVVTISRYDIIFTVLCIIAAAGVFLKTKNIRKRLIALAPAALNVTINTLLSVKITDNIIWVRLKSLRTLGLTLFAVFILACLIYSIFIIFRDKEDSPLITERGLFVSYMLAAGLATTVAMAFSPTIYISGYRTSCFTYFGMIYVILAIAGSLTDRFKPSERSVAPFIVACEVLFLLGRLLTVMKVSFGITG